MRILVSFIFVAYNNFFSISARTGSELLKCRSVPNSSALRGLASTRLPWYRYIPRAKRVDT
jgi:hypothetical protein